MATSSVQKPKENLVTRWVKRNFLWVKWEVEVQEGKQHVASQDFEHDDGYSEWRLELSLNSNPSLSLHFRMSEYYRDGDDDDEGDEDDIKEHFKNIVVTTVCDGELIELKPHMSMMQYKIPVSKQIKTDPGTILTFKFDIVELGDTSFQREGNFLRTILGSSELHDIEIKSADGQVLKAHKLILSIVSPVIKARCQLDGDESNVIETNFDFRSLKSWLDHFYQRNKIGPKTKLDALMNVFMVSDYFDTHDLTRYCRKVLISRLTSSNLSHVLQHDMIYLAGERVAYDVQEYILQVIEEIGLDEIEGLDSDNPRIAAFMPKILERTKKRKTDTVGSVSKKLTRRI